MTATPNKYRYTIKQKMTLLLSTVFVLLIIVSNTIHYLHATIDLKGRIKTNLEETASSLAGLLDGDKHATLREATDQNLSIYQDYFNLLAKQRLHFKKITYVYTMRLTPEGKVAYVIDADTESETNQPIGAVYDDADENFTELVGTLKSPASDDEFITDKWGKGLSAKPPIST